MTDWQAIESAPKDGTAFLAYLRVFSSETRELLFGVTHLVYCDDETGDLHDDCEQGWRLEDYEYWMPLPPPPSDQEKG